MSAEIVIVEAAVLSPWGPKARHALAGFLGAQVALVPNPFWDPSTWPRKDCGWVAGFDPRRDLPDRKATKLMSREAQLAVAAAREAWEGAVAREGSVRAGRIGVFGASGYEVSALEDVRELLIHSRSEAEPTRLDLGRAFTEGRDHYNPLSPIKTLPNMALYHVAQHLGAEGPHAALGSSPAAGIGALAAAVSSLRRLECDRAVVVGCDHGLEAFRALLLKEAGAFGPVAPAEGAAALVLARGEETTSAPVRISGCALGQDPVSDQDLNHRPAAGAVPTRAAMYRDATGDGIPTRILGDLWDDTGHDDVERAALSEAGLAGVATSGTAPLVGWLGAAHGLMDVALAWLLLAHHHDERVFVTSGGLAGDRAAVLLDARGPA